jgi:hypothetical protein
MPKVHGDKKKGDPPASFVIAASKPTAKIQKFATKSTAWNTAHRINLSRSKNV